MKSVEILVVDDSAADRTSLRFAFERAGAPVTLHFAENGKAALGLLIPTAARPAKLRPHLCLVDIKMPEVSGFDVLRAIKSHEEISHLPIIMYSGSDDPRDVRAAYRGFASGYIKKPQDADGLRKMASLLGRLCSDLMEFPSS